MFQKCNFCSSKLAIILFLTILYWNHCSWYWLRHSVYKTRICLKVEWMKSQTFNFKAEPDHLSFWVHSSLMYSKFFTCLEATLIHTENSFGWCYHYRPGHLNLHCLWRQIVQIKMPRSVILGNFGTSNFVIVCFHSRNLFSSRCQPPICWWFPRGRRWPNRNPNGRKLRQWSQPKFRRRRRLRGSHLKIFRNGSSICTWTWISANHGRH